MDETSSDRSGYVHASASAQERSPDELPPVVAAARSWIADRMVSLAREHGFPLRASPEVLALLSRCEWNEDAPLELYDVIARTVEWLQLCEREWSEAARDAGPHSSPSPDVR